MSAVELTALLIAVTDDEPRVLTVEDGAALPSGPFEQRHRSLQTGLRSWVERQTHHPLGYVEQLYTFADRDRVHGGEGGGRVVSIGYLGLTRESDSPDAVGSSWQSWYRYFPWEDRRSGAQAIPARGSCRDCGNGLRRLLIARPSVNARSARSCDFGIGDERSWNEDSCFNATSFSTRRAWWLKPRAAAYVARMLPSGTRCATTIAAFLRLGSRGYGPRSNTAPWFLS